VAGGAEEPDLDSEKILRDSNRHCDTFQEDSGQKKLLSFSSMGFSMFCTLNALIKLSCFFFLFWLSDSRFRNTKL
jgi:hypothetical protein